MPERARAVVLASTGTGDIIPNATVTVRNPGTSTAISETIYVNDDPDTSQYTNGAFFTNATGLVTFYLTNPKRVDVLFTKTGYTSVTIPVDVQNSATGYGLVQEEGSNLTARAKLNFIGSGVTAADDAANGRTNVTITSSAETLPATIMDAKGDWITATAADTPVRKAAPSNGHLFVADSAQSDGWKSTTGTPSATTFLRGDGAWAGVSGLLTSVYDRTSTSPTTTSTTSVDVLAALAVTFTAPTSGAVLVRLTGHPAVDQAADVRWNLREGAADVANTEAVVLAAAAATATRFIISKAIKVTGLTAGNSYTYKWGWRTSAGTATLHIAGAGTDASMEVWSA